MPYLLGSAVWEKTGVLIVKPVAVSVLCDTRTMDFSAIIVIFKAMVLTFHSIV